MTRPLCQGQGETALGPIVKEIGVITYKMSDAPKTQFQSLN